MPYSPCPTCPFRTDITFPLTEEKAKRIVEALHSDGDFPCHKTITPTDTEEYVYEPGSKACIGASIFLENTRQGGLMTNLSFRLRVLLLKEFTIQQLNLDSPVFTSIESFIQAKTGANGNK
jgi:hypothetical protein